MSRIRKRKIRERTNFKLVWAIRNGVIEKTGKHLITVIILIMTIIYWYIDCNRHQRA